jgi:hypothetical protein
LKGVSVLGFENSSNTFCHEDAREIFQSVFMIKKLLVINHETSIPVFEMNFSKNTGVDSSLISGVFQAISSIGTDIVGAPTSIKKLEFHGFVVTSAFCGAYTVYLFSERDVDQRIIKGLSNVVQWFDTIFGFEGGIWDGSIDRFTEDRRTIEEKICKELFLWLLFPLSVPIKALNILEDLEEAEQEIISFISSKGKTSSMKLIDHLNRYENEEVLYHLINLADSGYVTIYSSD